MNFIANCKRRVFIGVLNQVSEEISTFFTSFVYRLYVFENDQVQTFRSDLANFHKSLFNFSLLKFNIAYYKSQTLKQSNHQSIDRNNA